MPGHGWYQDGAWMRIPKTTDTDNQTDTQDTSEDTEQEEEEVSE